MDHASDFMHGGIDRWLRSTRNRTASTPEGSVELHPQWLALQQEHVGDASLRELERDAGADGPAADDDDSRLVHAHAFTRAMPGS